MENIKNIKLKVKKLSIFVKIYWKRMINIDKIGLNVFC